METQINQTSASEEIQVYRNEFFSGMILLMKRLFML
jgi:hypothetical protein